MVKVKLTEEIKNYIDSELKSKQYLTYIELIESVRQKYGIALSKASISKRAKALQLNLRRGRKSLIGDGKKPAHSIFLECAGSFFLKAAELETGLLAAVNQLLEPNTDSVAAKKTLKMAQQINAILLFAPIFGRKSIQKIIQSQRRELTYLTEQQALPAQEEIAQYLHFLTEEKLLDAMNKEVTKMCTEALFISIEYAGQLFYIDGQSCTVWPNHKIPHSFSTTINKAKSYVKRFLLNPTTQDPLILQACPGYTFLPTEMFSLMQCFEQTTPEESISGIMVVGKFGEILASWQNLNPLQKRYFIAPLTPWQAAKLQDLQIIKDYQTFRIGQDRKTMSIADAWVTLINTQLSKNIRVRAALIKGKAKDLTLITNIAPHQERYIQKIVERYFWRWPQKGLKTYHDLLEEAQQEQLIRAKDKPPAIALPESNFKQGPEEVFRNFLGFLHRYALGHFFPTENAGEDLQSMSEKFFRQSGYLKIKQNCWEVILHPFAQKNLQQIAQFAGQKINQSDIKFSNQRSLRIYLQLK